MTADEFRAAVQPFKGCLSYDEAERLLKEVFEVRMINGFRVRDGWKMPEPPRSGMQPVMVMHGSDGLSLFWWDPTESKYPPTEPKDPNHFIDNDPLVNPDTGHNYKACQDAYLQLGFVV